VSRGRKRAAGNPLSADGPEVLFLLPKGEDTANVEHAAAGGKRDSEIRAAFAPGVWKGP
jgi:hypothetical protein